MPRVKKIIKAEKGVVAKKSTTVPEFEQVPRGRAPEELIQEPVTTPTTPVTPQAPKQHSVNVTGYGDITMDDEMSRFISDKMNSFTGDQKIKDQFGYVSDLYKRGGLQSINEAGVGTGEADPSLTNRRATRRQFWTGNSRDYNRQQAAAQYNKWIQEYAKQKHADANKPKEIISKDYSLNLRDRVGKSSGGWNDQYWGGLSMENKKAGVSTALTSYLDELGGAGDFDEKTHKGIDANRYQYLRDNRNKILEDFNSIKDVNGDGKLDSNEMSNFVKSHGINPFDVLGFSAPKTEAQLKEDAEAQAKLDAQKAEQAKENIANRKKEALGSLGLKGDWRWSGEEKDDTNFGDRTKWRFYEDNVPSNKLHAKGFSTIIDDYNDGLFYEGYRIPFSDINQTGIQQHLQALGIQDEAAADLGASKIYDMYNAGIENIQNKDPRFKLLEDLGNIRNKQGSQYQLLKNGAMDRSNELPEDKQHEGYKKYVVANPDKTDRTKPFKEVIINPKGFIVESFKNGGSINFNKVKKFKYGGASTVRDEEAVQRRQSEIMDTAAKRDASEMRSVSGKEVFDDNYQLTGADKADLAAVGLDIAGLVAGFVPGGSVVSGVTGLGSTLAGAGAQASREGKLSWDNVLNTGASAAMDVASLVPGVGQFAKGMKIAKWIKTGGKWATKALQMYGYGQAAQVGLKLANEGPSSITAQEWQQFLGGLKGIQGGIRNKAIKSGTETVLPDRSTMATTDGKNLEFNMSGKKLSEVMDQDVIKSKKLIGSKLDELNEARTTNLAGKTPDQINALETEVKSLKDGLTTKLAGAGLDNQSAQSITDANLKLGVDDMQGVLNSGKFWKKSSWQSPLVQGAKINDVSSNVRVLKDGDLNAWQRWGRSHAKSAGYASKAQVQGELAALPSQVEMNRLSGEESIFNKRLEKGAESRKKLAEQVTTNKKDIKTKTAEGETLKADYDVKSQERKGKYDDYKKARSTFKDADTDYQTKNKTYLADDLAFEAARKTPGNTFIQAARKRKASRQLRDDAEVVRTDAETKKKASKTEYQKSFDESKKVKDEINQTNQAIDKSKKDIESAFNKGKRLKDINKRTTQKLEDTKKAKSEASEKLRGETTEAVSKYSSSKADGFKGNKKSKSTAASLIAAAGVGAVTGHAASKAKENKDLQELSTRDLDANIKVLEDALKTETSIKEKDRIRQAINKYKSAKSKKTAVEKKAKGGVVKFNIGGSVGHLQGTVTKTMPDYIAEGVNKVVTPSALKFLNTSVTNKQLMGKIKELPRPTNMIAPTTTKLKNVGMGSAMSQYNQIGAQENSMKPMYSDAKLNAAMKLATSANASQMKNQIGQQLQAQNQQVDSTNAQLYSQDAATRAQTAAQNAAQQRQYDTTINQYEQGLIRSEGQSRDNLLSEWQHKREGFKDKIMNLDLQDEQTSLRKNYQTALEDLKNQYTAKTNGLDLNTYFEKNPKEKALYDQSVESARNTYNKDWSQAQRRIYTGGSKAFKSGGSIEEKKELEYQKAEIKRIAQKDKAFNKMILDKMKSHEKMLSLLMKK